MEGVEVEAKAEAEWLVLFCFKPSMIQESQRPAQVGG